MVKSIEKCLWSIMDDKEVIVTVMTTRVAILAREAAMLSLSIVLSCTLMFAT